MHTAVQRLALDGGMLRSLFARFAVGWDEFVAVQMVSVAAQQIAASVEARGKTSYSLVLKDGQSDGRRVGAVRRYLSKLIACRLAELPRPGDRVPEID